MLRSFVQVALFSATTSTAAAVLAQGAPGDHFVQEEFVISYWVTPPNDGQLAERFQELVDAHFNVILAGYDAKAARAELELCQKYGIKALFWYTEDESIIHDPAVLGGVVGDEPGLPTRSFEMYHQRYRRFKDRYPGKLGFINLYPNYASREQLGFDTYEEHVSVYREMFKPEVLSMDHYPTFQADGDGRDAYCENLATMREHSLKAGIPFWNFFNVMPYGQHTDPTESQLRWQIFSSLTYGAKGVLYFCYYTPRGNEFLRGGAIIDRNGRKTRHYAQAQRLNLELKHLGPTLMQLTSQDVRRVQGMEAGPDALAGTPLREIVNTYTPRTPMDLQIGTFRHTDGRQAVLLHNYEHTLTAWVTVTFDADPAEVVEVDKATGEEVPLYDESPAMEGVQISFDAGEGRLFLIRP